MDKKKFLYDRFVSKLGFSPTDSQDRMLSDIAEFISTDSSDIHVVNGFAGTGKTTAISAIVSVFSDLSIPFKLMAPTGRSAKNIQKYTGKSASTIHLSIYRLKSTAEDGVGHYVLGHNDLKNAVIIVDEVSLIGIESDKESMAMFGNGNLLYDLISFCRSGFNCKLILIGDGAQLPPIQLEQSPALCEEYMSSYGNVNFSYMTDVVRQEAESGIITNATILREHINNYFEPIGIDELCLQVGSSSDIERISGADLIECLQDAYAKYGEDEVMVLCRNNKRANKYNLGIRNQIYFKDDRLERGDSLMIVKNWYNPNKKDTKDENFIDFIANGELVKLKSAKNYIERYGFEFADATLSLLDKDEKEIRVKICLDTLVSESPSLTYEQQNNLYRSIYEDYADLKSKSKIHKKIKEDPYFTALQIKYANAITCHKAQGGQWDCIFIDHAFWEEFFTLNDLKWLYTALTRAVKKVYLVNFKDEYFLV